MPDELVTAGVFGDQTQAVAARLLLEAAGIPAFLHDELVAGGIFLWSPAVGGIKLQVPESRLDDAIKLLDEQMPGEKGATDWSKVDVGVPEADEPPADEDDESETEGTPQTPIVAATEERAFAEPTFREQQAEVLYRGWLFGLFVFPVLIFMWWQLIWVALNPERLSPEYRRKARIAAFCILISTLLWLSVGLIIYFAIAN